MSIQNKSIKLHPANEIKKIEFNMRAFHQYLNCKNTENVLIYLSQLGNRYQVTTDNIPSYCSVCFLCGGLAIFSISASVRISGQSATPRVARVCSIQFLLPSVYPPSRARPDQRTRVPVGEKRPPPPPMTT
ncbi:hypothetical protein QTP88_008966 [Uroleucon formosanum]